MYLFIYLFYINDIYLFIFLVSIYLFLYLFNYLFLYLFLSRPRYLYACIDVSTACFLLWVIYFTKFGLLFIYSFIYLPVMLYLIINITCIIIIIEECRLAIRYFFNSSKRDTICYSQDNSQDYRTVTKLSKQYINTP